MSHKRHAEFLHRPQDIDEPFDIIAVFRGINDAQRHPQRARFQRIVQVPLRRAQFPVRQGAGFIAFHRSPHGTVSDIHPHVQRQRLLSGKGHVLRKRFKIVV